jgi:hypothetical protein
MARRERDAEEAEEDAPSAPPQKPFAGLVAVEKGEAGTDEAAAAPAREEGLFGRIRHAVANYSAPASPLAEDEHPDAAAAEFRAQAKVADKFADRGKSPVDEDEELLLDWLPQPSAGSAAPLAPNDACAEATQKARRASPALVERIASARSGGGAKILVVSDADSMASCASLALARAMAREGRAILVQIDSDDKALTEALERADSAEAYGEPQAGLAQLLQGEASFAEAIYRDGASRLHIIQSGGAFDDDFGDLDLILDALQSTYDFVLIASGGSAEAARLCADADLTLIFAGDGRARDFLYDDFEAVGARAILLAGMDSLGEIVEMAA